MKKGLALLFEAFKVLPLSDNRTLEPLNAMKHDTDKEIARMIAGGMQLISKRELVERAAACGYHIDASASFSYRNKANKFTYLARSIGWRHTASGERFAHVNAPKDTLPALQEIRFSCFVVERGRIWEL